MEPSGSGEDHTRRVGAAPAAVVARQRPEIAGLGPPPARIEHRGRGLVEEQFSRLLQPLGHARDDGREVEGGLADPVRQRRAADLDPGAGEDLRLTIQMR